MDLTEPIPRRPAVGDAIGEKIRPPVATEYGGLHLVLKTEGKRYQIEYELVVLESTCQSGTLGGISEYPSLDTGLQYDLKEV